MPPRTFALLIGGVIFSAGLTIALAHWAGLSFAALGLVTLIGSLILGLRRPRS
jgi:hypothetical protein